MKRLCSSCGERRIYIERAAVSGHQGHRDHDVCSKCYRSFRSQTVARRQLPKPFWNERGTLTLLARAGKLRLE